MNSNWSYSPETLNSDQNQWFFVWFDLEIWWITLKNKKASLLYYVKPCTSFQSHGWIQIGVTVNSRQNRQFFVLCDLKFDGWPWKTIGHFFYAASSLVHHFIAISQFKLELQCGKSQNPWIFLSHVTLKFDRWPWKTIWNLFYVTSSFVHHLVAIGELKL